MPFLILRLIGVAVTVLSVVLALVLRQQDGPQAAGAPREIRWDIPDQARVYDLAWSSTGDRLGVVVDPLSGASGSVLVFEPAKPHRDPFSLPYEFPAAMIGPSDSAAFLVSTYSGKLYRTADGGFDDQPISGARLSTWVKALSVLPDGRVVLAWDDGVELIDKCGRVAWTARDVADVMSLSATHDGRLIVAGTDRKQVVVLDGQSGRIVRTLCSREHTGRAVVTPDGRHVVGVSRSGQLTCWSVSTGQIAWERASGQSDVQAMAVSPDSRTIAIAGLGERVSLWDLSGTCTAKYDTENVCSLAFSPDSRKLACGTHQGTVHVFGAQWPKLPASVTSTATVPPIPL